MSNNKFNKELDPTYDRESSTVDPFDVEAFVRVCLMMDDEMKPEDITMSYNDFIDYTTYVIKMAFESHEKVLREKINERKGK